MFQNYLVKNEFFMDIHQLMTTGNVGQVLWKLGEVLSAQYLPPILKLLPQSFTSHLSLCITKKLFHVPPQFPGIEVLRRKSTQ
jgi:hypothetical protein